MTWRENGQGIKFSLYEVSLLHLVRTTNISHLDCSVASLLVRMSGPSLIALVADHPSPRHPKRHYSQASIKHLWPIGDMKTQALCLMSTSAIPSFSETVAVGNLRKNRAAPSRSSMWARLVPTQAIATLVRYAADQSHEFMSGHLQRVPAPNPMYASSISLVGFCHRSGSNLKKGLVELKLPNH